MGLDAQHRATTAVEVRPAVTFFSRYLKDDDWARKIQETSTFSGGTAPRALTGLSQLKD